MNLMINIVTEFYKKRLFVNAINSLAARPSLLYYLFRFRPRDVVEVTFVHSANLDYLWCGRLRGPSLPARDSIVTYSYLITCFFLS